MKKVLITLLLGLFLISFASAAIIEEINVETNLSITCINAGTCSQDAYCKINIISPTSVYVANGENMTRVGEIFYYNITPTELGTYKVGGFCLDGEDSEEIDYCFKVTPNGEELNLYKTIIISIGILIIILFSLYFIYLGKNSKQDGPKLFLYVLAFFFGLFATGIITSTIDQNLFGFGTVSGIFSSFYLLLTILSGTIVISLIIWLIISTLQKWNKMRGYSDNFDDFQDF